jgi:hypothetical protein
MISERFGRASTNDGGGEGRDPNHSKPELIELFHHATQRAGGRIDHQYLFVGAHLVLVLIESAGGVSAE